MLHLKVKSIVSMSIIGMVIVMIPIIVSGKNAYGKRPYHINNSMVHNVTPITEVKDKLDGLSEEEKTVLDSLFMITQEILE